MSSKLLSPEKVALGMRSGRLLSLKRTSCDGYEGEFNRHNGKAEMEGESSSEFFQLNQGLLTGEDDEYEASDLFSFDFRNFNDRVFVAVGKPESRSSMGALAWTLKHLVSPSTVVHLIHVYPVIRQIPSPLGMLPRSKVTPELVQSYVREERYKRRKLLQKFVDTCTASEIKVDVKLVESDNIAKSILSLIPILNITKLVVGTTESSLRKTESRRGDAIADRILKNAPETGEIKIVCEGKEVIDRMIEWASPRSNSNEFESTKIFEEDQPKAKANSFFCMCFR
ncbi:U-box domain-containing protein 35 [Morella rubra]|uniref:U-box domain-containing protein 35 n=1 Tax=Morella rubra TaxID=262757 RepID=A0A6A1W8R3_9ROSI|nr:U-box domain-containing protein 35 [Morella rubra]